MSEQDWRHRVRGHRERLRERFLKNGIDGFTDSDVIEFLLTFGTPRQDCKDRARALLKRFGSLSGVLEASMDELQEVRGVGPKNAVAVKFVHDVARRFLRDRIQQRRRVSRASDVVDYLWHSLSHREKEIFICLYLDSSNGIIEMEELFSGTLDQAPVYPREILKRAMELVAKSVILVHNHPSGRTTPSSMDVSVTKRVITAALALDVEVLDHIIVGRPGEYYSFQEEGLMESLKAQVSGAFKGLF